MIHIRNAKRGDCKEIRRLLQELAEFEKLSENLKLNAEFLEKDGFDTEQPPFQCIVAEHPERTANLIGYALYSIGYASWKGRRLYLEDIMVTEEYRKSGVGKLLFTKICQEAIKFKCKVINFVVLDWNPACKFYKNLGAEDLTETLGWHFFNINEEKIKEVAESVKKEL